MRTLFIAIAAFFVLYGCSPAAFAQKKPVILSANDWYAYTKGQRYDKPADAFQLSDSMVRLYGDKAGYLMSKQSYTDFELSLEFRWNMEPAYAHGSGKKNSGVMYNVPDTAQDMLWPAGIQFQVKEGATGDFILLGNVTLEVRGETKAPGASVAVARLSEQEKPLGEWNILVLKSNKGVCSQYLNGQLVNEGSNASSKSGRLLLQYEGSPIDFRKIQIRKL
jgi:hypothetical protein